MSERGYRRVQREVAMERDWEEELKQGIPVPVFCPNRVDLEVTDKCINNCPDCINRKTNNTKPLPSFEKLVSSLDTFNEYCPEDYMGRRHDEGEAVVISGGEPLMRPGLITLQDMLQEREICTSISTTGYDPYSQFDEVTRRISSIGIPIDGHTPEINGIWRGRGKSDGGLKIAIDALKRIRHINPDAVIKIRTLVHPRNIDDVHKIPQFLIDSGINISDGVRWTIYEQYHRLQAKDHKEATQLRPSGTITNSHLGLEGFKERVLECGSKFEKVAVKTLVDVALKYFIIDPYGECRVTKFDTLAPEIVVEEDLGNIIKDPAGVVIGFNNLDANTMAHMSGGAFGYFYDCGRNGMPYDTFSWED